MKVDKQRILDVLDARGEAVIAGEVDANLPPEVDFDRAHHVSALERLGVDVDEVRREVLGVV